MWEAPWRVVRPVSHCKVHTVRPSYCRHLHCLPNYCRALSNVYGDAGLRVYITGDGSDVYEDSFMKKAKDAHGSFHPTLVLVGIRLGIDRVTPVYWEALKASLQLPQSIGIAG